ncbi:general stress protein [Thermoactinospora rubra]|uniref:general stress protein n=1 Tax=Thermoactinospora rubra TaxID=1088767 RepID=UPI000A109451|nr:general stress protein [Thermoactinospora rubra]
MIETAPAVGWAGVGDRPVVGSYDTYDQAQKAVAFLAENGFPIQRAGIVGSGLRTAETVLGRLTVTRSAGMGAATGARFGLMAGLLVGLFAASGPVLALVLSGVADGALFGAAFGLAAHFTMRGRRDFVSRHAIVAARYDIVADVAVADDARNLLIKYGWRTG